LKNLGVSKPDEIENGDAERKRERVAIVRGRKNNGSGRYDSKDVVVAVHMAGGVEEVVPTAAVCVLGEVSGMFTFIVLCKLVG